MNFQQARNLIRVSCERWLELCRWGIIVWLQCRVCSADILWMYYSSKFILLYSCTCNSSHGMRNHYFWEHSLSIWIVLHNILPLLLIFMALDCCQVIESNLFACKIFIYCICLNIIRDLLGFQSLFLDLFYIWMLIRKWYSFSDLLIYLNLHTCSYYHEW